MGVDEAKAHWWRDVGWWVRRWPGGAVLVPFVQVWRYMWLMLCVRMQKRRRYLRHKFRRCHREHKWWRGSDMEWHTRCVAILPFETAQRGATGIIGRQLSHIALQQLNVSLSNERTAALYSGSGRGFITKLHICLPAPPSAPVMRAKEKSNDREAA